MMMMADFAEVWGCQSVPEEDVWPLPGDPCEVSCGDGGRDGWVDGEWTVGLPFREEGIPFDFGQPSPLFLPEDGEPAGWSDCDPGPVNGEGELKEDGVVLLGALDEDGFAGVTVLKPLGEGGYEVGVLLSEEKTDSFVLSFETASQLVQDLDGVDGAGPPEDWDPTDFSLDQESPSSELGALPEPSGLQEGPGVQVEGSEWSLDELVNLLEDASGSVDAFQAMEADPETPAPSVTNPATPTPSGADPEPRCSARRSCRKRRNSDQDWHPKKRGRPGAATTPETPAALPARGGGKAATPAPVDRRARKRLQNRVAAQRYRERKRFEGVDFEEQERLLQLDNEHLRRKEHDILKLITVMQDFIKKKQTKQSSP